MSDVDLKPDPHNANRGTPRGHGIIEQSIRRHGAGRSGLAANDGTMIAGSQTLEEMAALGIPIKTVHTTGEEWVVVVRDDIEPGSETAALMAIADNRASELGLDWDAGVLDGLIGEGIDLSTLFRDGELPIAVEEPEAQPADDDAPSSDTPTRCQPGDVWRVGPHTVCCLDSTDRALVEQWAKGITFVVADPPYGIKAVDENSGQTGGLGKQGEWGYSLAGGSRPGTPMKTRKYAPIVGDESTDTAIDAALLALDLCPKSVQFWWGANNYADALPPSSCWIVWDKDTGDNAFADCELAWSNHSGAVRKFDHKWNGVMRATECGERRTHPTQKPVALFLWLYERYGKPGDLIFDPFLGSGPSLKAAHRMGDRTVIGFELSPHYIDHILEWAESNGLSCERAE